MSKFEYDRFSQLTGDIAPAPTESYQVSYRKVARHSDAVKTFFLTLASVGVEVGFLVWLLVSFLTPIFGSSATIGATFLALLACIFIIESFRLIAIISFAFSALVARDPVPVRPEPGKRLAFTTAIVPSKEPFEMVKKTLLAMKKVTYDGTIDVWLLDEGNLPEIRKVCKELGINHFSRKDVPEWNQPTGDFKAKTKHGNFNAWLQAEGHQYDYVMSVDADHIPLKNYAERMIGYFRDQNVAYVVGPQVYGNTETIVARGAESQSYVFQATIQRAANAYDAAMFVGTNHAYRVKTMQSIGGFQDSITEDMYTGMRVHSSRNPDTGRFWKSVYTPDVLAVGEGPSSWTDFFTQQLRWSRGANEILLKNFAGLFVKLPFRAKLHYGLIIWCYPAAGLTWAMGIVVSMLYLLLGTTGVGLPDKTWLALYIDVLATQLILYAWLRKYNVSPHEPKGSFGVSGILFSIFAAPIYTYALFNTLIRRNTKFVVTPKGDTSSPDTLQTFKYHLLWAGWVAAFLAYSIVTGNSHINVKIWCTIALVSCLTPIVIWKISCWPETRRRWAAMFSFNRKALKQPTQKGVIV